MKTCYVDEIRLYYILSGDCNELLSLKGHFAVGEEIEIRANGCPEVITATILNVNKTINFEKITIGNIQCKISIKDPENLLGTGE